MIDVPVDRRLGCDAIDLLLGRGGENGHGRVEGALEFEPGLGPFFIFCVLLPNLVLIGGD